PGIITYADRSDVLGGPRPGGCQVRLANTVKRAGGAIPAPENPQIGLESRANAGLARAVGAVGVDVERTRRSLDHFLRNYHLLDALKARKVEHGVEQDALHNGAQPTRASLALDRLLGNGAERLFREREVDALHLE